MTARSDESASTRAEAAERFVLRELIARWNRALDRGSLPALRELSAPGIELEFEGVSYRGETALEEFVAACSVPGLARRTHVNHVQAWVTNDGRRSRSLTMVVHLVEQTSPTGDGSLFPSWTGYAEDSFVSLDGRWRIASRRFVRWNGEVLAGFRRFREEAA